MARGKNQKLKLLYLAKILKEKTDEENGITMPELIKELESYGVDCDPVRKESIIIYGDRNTLVKRSRI